MYLGLFLLIPNISISQVIGNHGGGMDLLGLARVSGLGTKDLLCLMKATKTKKIETDLLESWNRKYETHTDIIDLIDYILIEETIKGLNYFIPVIKSPVFKCENQSEDSTFTLSKRNNAEKELDLLKEMLSAWEQGRDGFEAQNICEEYFAPRVKRLDDLKKVIELYEKKP
jgi:hypothetical protein